MVFLENVYMILDPYTESPHSICLGGNCCCCGKPVCADRNCSIFYGKRFCFYCAKKYIDAFPEEICKEINNMKQEDST